MASYRVLVVDDRPADRVESVQALRESESDGDRFEVLAPVATVDQALERSTLPQGSPYRPDIVVLDDMLPRSAGEAETPQSLALVAMIVAGRRDADAEWPLCVLHSTFTDQHAYEFRCAGGHHARDKRMVRREPLAELLWRTLDGERWVPRQHPPSPSLGDMEQQLLPYLDDLPDQSNSALAAATGLTEKQVSGAKGRLFEKLSPDLVAWEQAGEGDRPRANNRSADLVRRAREAGYAWVSLERRRAWGGHPPVDLPFDIPQHGCDREPSRRLG